MFDAKSYRDGRKDELEYLHDRALYHIRWNVQYLIRTIKRNGHNEYSKQDYICMLDRIDTSYHYMLISKFEYVMYTNITEKIWWSNNSMRDNSCDR